MSLMALYEARLEGGDLQPDPEQAALVALLADFGTTLEASVAPGILGRLLGNRPDPGMRGLYIWGGVGRGKSMIMDLFFIAVDVERKQRLHFLEFMQDVHARLHDVRQTETRDAILPVADDLARAIRLLCIDEFQISDIADGVVVGRLLEQLLARDVTLVTTSNRPPDDLCKDGLNRHLFTPYVRMLKEQLTIHEFGGDMDYRKQRLAGQQKYFWPLSDTTTTAVRTIWNDLSGGQSAALTLEINARQIVFPCFANGVLRSSFWELCGQPLGPPDFLAIAGHIRMLILEGIPQLSRSNYNEARRFVMLVDALYDAGVDLVATAVERPELLYIEGTGAFEFERTASRLREMQSRDWGQACA